MSATAKAAKLRKAIQRLREFDEAFYVAFSDHDWREDRRASLAELTAIAAKRYAAEMNVERLLGELA